MVKRPNYLLGFGERLTENVEIKGGGGDKLPPYPFEESKTRLTRMLETTVAALNDLPEAACPNGETVVSITLHPEYFAKSHYPGGLLRETGLRNIGSRSRTLKPDKRSRGRKPEDMVTTELFVAGARSSFERFAESLPKWTEVRSESKHLAAIEEIAAIKAASRVKPMPAAEKVPLEVVLHASESNRDQFIVRGFQDYLKKLELEADMERMFFAGRLCFLRMYAPSDFTEQIAKYSFLRVLRQMPKLRVTRPIIRGIPPRPKKTEFPAEGPTDPNLRVAVFDGGIPEGSPLLAWADAHDVPGIGDPHPDLLWHGETVTSALLFGSPAGERLAKPVCHVDHYRVLDVNSEKDPFELHDVLERITAVLDTRPYEFVSLSIGPTLEVDDEDVHAWTAVLDERLSDGRCLATIAAGNTGHEPDDPVLRPWRVQVPSDCVNALTVGASDCTDGEWNRAAYSSRGPGRSPGIVKPDLVTFGGSERSRFWVCDPDTANCLVSTAGTSYAAPSAMRDAATVRAHFGPVLSPLAIKALLVHSTEDGGHTRDEVGWGRLPSNSDTLVTCPDGCARIVYQDEITASKFRRIRIPMPRVGLTGDVYITATFCYATDIDPEHPGNYTRSGLEVRFRPNMTDFAKNDAVHPKTAEFFRPAKLYPEEQELRKDAHKWETCLHARKRKRSSSLSDPVFDIHYNARSQGHDDAAPHKIRYALAITVEAPRVKDLYDRIVRAYPALLEPLNPVIELPVRI